MNLRVDLITVEEQRSASPVRLGFVLRAGGTLLAALVVIGAALFWLKVTTQSRELKRVERELVDIKEHFAQAQILQKQFDLNRNTRDDLRAVKLSRLVWHEQLAALRRIVPEYIQLTQLSVNMLDKGPARLFTVRMIGKAVGENPDEDVATLEKRLTHDEFFVKYVASAKVPPGAFVEGRWPGAKRTDRQFVIVCTYIPVVSP